MFITKKIRTFVNIMKGLSILIPTFNDECLDMVKELSKQCSPLEHYEIIVADDGSTDSKIVETNKETASFPHCRFIARSKNSGRAAIRNFLASQAQYDKLLFIDCGRRLIRDDFIAKYYSCKGDAVVYGGYNVIEQPTMSGNLRYRYEMKEQENHTYEMRQQHPYMDFNTCNVLIPQKIITNHPFNESYYHYGYEDVAYGIELSKANIPILHIDNPMGLYRFESNSMFVAKTEESIRTLVAFRTQLEGYSRLLAGIRRLHKWHLTWACQAILFPLLMAMRRQLTGNNPNLCMFKAYKAGYLLSLLKKERQSKK